MERPDLMWTIIEMFSLEALLDRCEMRRSKNYYNSNSLTFCNTSQGEICRYKTSFFSNELVDVVEDYNGINIAVGSLQNILNWVNAAWG